MVTFKLRFKEEELEQMFEAKVLMQKKVEINMSMEDVINFLVNAYVVTQSTPAAAPPAAAANPQFFNKLFYNPN